MARVSEALRRRRLRVLERAAAKYANEVLLVALWRSYQDHAEHDGGEDLRINSVGGFAKFVRAEGYATAKRDGQTVVMVGGMQPETTPEKAAPAPELSPDSRAASFPLRSYSALAPLRVDSALVLHNVAEAYEGMFDLAGQDALQVTAFLADRVDRLRRDGPDKLVCLEILSGALALNGA